ncbi:hypothetical protein CVT24_013414, partial [Panaeolus cyanescens]
MDISVEEDPTPNSLNYFSVTFIEMSFSFEAPTTLGSALKEESYEVAPFTKDENVTDIDMNN